MVLKEVLRCCDEFEAVIASRSFLAGDTFADLVALKNRFAEGRADRQLLARVETVVKRIERYWLGHALGVSWNELEMLQAEALNSVTVLRIMAVHAAPRPAGEPARTSTRAAAGVPTQRRIDLPFEDDMAAASVAVATAA